MTKFNPEISAAELASQMGAEAVDPPVIMQSVRTQHEVTCTLNGVEIGSKVLRDSEVHRYQVTQAPGEAVAEFYDGVTTARENTRRKLTWGALATVTAGGTSAAVFTFKGMDALSRQGLGRDEVIAGLAGAACGAIYVSANRMMGRWNDEQEAQGKILSTLFKSFNNHVSVELVPKNQVTED